jgi:hypothetical protein
MCYMKEPVNVAGVPKIQAQAHVVCIFSSKIVPGMKR